jgi:hypothetical protein
VGNAGCRCTRSLVCETKQTHELVTKGSPDWPGIPARNGFTAYFALSPATRLYCHRRLRIWYVKTRLVLRTSTELTPASGRQNHTTSPSAKSVCRPRAIRQLTGLVDPPCHPLTSPDAAASTASRPASVTIAIRPSSGTRRFGYASDLGQRRSEIFLQKGLDKPFRKTRSDLPVRQNRCDPAQCRPRAPGCVKT